MSHRNYLPVIIASLCLPIGMGCSSPKTIVTSSSGANQPATSNSPVTSPNSPVTKPGQPNQAPHTESSASTKSPGQMPPAGKTSTVSPQAVPPPVRENPQAAPPKPGEQVVKDFKFETPTQSIEIEGICKLTEDDATCWKPNGDSNDDLAKELTNAIQSKTDSYSNSFQFKFRKKNRILVIKTTTKPPKPGTNSSSYANVMNQYGGSSEFSEGWTNSNSIFSSASATGFDQARIERQVLTGAFNKETSTFPIRYQLMTSDPANSGARIEVKKGPFTVAGNTYEIVSISDKAPYQSNPYGMSNQKMKFSYLAIKPIKIVDPNVLIFLHPADESGQPYGGLDAEGNPISQAQVEKAREEQMKKMSEAARNGKPYAGNYYQQNSYIQSGTIDSSMSPRTTSHGIQFNVEPSKLKKLIVSVQKRTVYVFDKIRLDKN